MLSLVVNSGSDDTKIICPSDFWEGELEAQLQNYYYYFFLLAIKLIETMEKKINNTFYILMFFQDDIEHAV